jgi:hypothetical protein
MALTVLSIENARPQAKAYKLSDERSLFLLVMPNGANTGGSDTVFWASRRRWRLASGQKSAWPKYARSATQPGRWLPRAGTPARRRSSGRSARSLMRARRSSRRRGMDHKDHSGRPRRRYPRQGAMAARHGLPADRRPPGQSDRRHLRCWRCCASLRRPAGMKARAGCAASSAASCATGSPLGGRSAMWRPISAARSPFRRRSILPRSHRLKKVGGLLRDD